MHGWVDRWKDVWVDRYMNGWMDGSMDVWIDGWMDGWMDGWDETGGGFFSFNGHFLTTLKIKFKKKTADFPGGPVVKSPSANAGTQLPSLVQENSTHLGPTRPMSHNDRSPCTKRLCAYTGEATSEKPMGHSSTTACTQQQRPRKTKIHSEKNQDCFPDPALFTDGRFVSALASSKSVSIVFPTPRVHSVSLSHTLVILTGFHTSSR